jgi:hypothetical protein
VVRVQGPESIVETIDKVLVRISVQGMTRDIRTETPIILIDRNGDEMDTSRLELSRSSVSVTVAIWADKEIPITYGYTGTPAEGFATTGNLTATINALELSGDPDALSGIGSITIPSSEIDISGATENYTTVIDVSAFLPAGTRPADMDMDTVFVSDVGSHNPHKEKRIYMDIACNGIGDCFRRPSLQWSHQADSRAIPSFA